MRKAIAKTELAFTDINKGDIFDIYTLEEIKDIVDEKDYINLVKISAEKDIVGYVKDRDGDYIQIYSSEIDGIEY